MHDYAPDGNVARVDEVRCGSTNSTYNYYDDANRLVKSEIVNDSDELVRRWVYEYNNRGDRTKQVVTNDKGENATTLYEYENHRLASENTDGSMTEYEYDENGNTVAKTTDGNRTEFEYSERNELIRTTDSTGETVYAYDAMSRRVTKNETDYVWAGDNIIREEESEKNTDYFYGINRVSRMISGEKYTYTVTKVDYDDDDNEIIETVDVYGFNELYAYDGRGNVVHTMLLDSIDLYLSPSYGREPAFPEIDLNEDGVIDLVDLMGLTQYCPVVRDYKYSPFGEVWNGEKENDTNPYRYAGEYWDKETGNIYLRARYYDPRVGRFITVDLIKDGTNWYVYCANNPIAFVDPSGLAGQPYEPEKWNDNGEVQLNTNCYAYALDWNGCVTYGNFANDTFSAFESQPGFLRSDTNTLLNNLYNSNDNDGVRALCGAILDSNNNNHTFRLATDDNIMGKDLGENEWVVYLVARSDSSGYHWYRQNFDENGQFDGTWSHKPGNTPVSDRTLTEMHHLQDGTVSYVYSDNVITNPQQSAQTPITHYYYSVYNGTIDEGSTITSSGYDVVIGAYVVGY